MRREEFKMERTGLLEIGDVLPITEGKLPIPITIHWARRTRCRRTMW